MLTKCAVSHSVRKVKGAQRENSRGADSSGSYAQPAAEFQLLSIAKSLLKLGKNIAMKLNLDKLDSYGACVASELESGFSEFTQFSIIILLFNIDV